MRNFLIILWCILALLVTVGCLFFIQPLFWKIVLIVFSIINLPAAIGMIAILCADKKLNRETNGKLQLQKNSDLPTKETEG